MKNKILTILFIALCLFVPYSKINAATLSLSSNNLNISVGDTVIVKVGVDTLGKTINNAEGTISFQQDMLKVISISKNSSIFSLWVVEPSFNNITGKVTWNGGLPTPGFVGANGSIISITFRAVKKGTAPLSFTSGVVRENDGFGTDITGNLGGVVFSIKNVISKPAPIIAPVPKTEPVPAITIPTTDIVDVITDTNQNPQTSKPLEIASGEQNGRASIVGYSSYPKAEATVTFTAIDGARIFITGYADTEGYFNILIPSSLQYGTYAVSAFMVKEDKTNSETSNAIIVKISNILFGVPLETWLFIIILFILIFDIFFHIYFYLKRKEKKDDEHMNIYNR